jgi:hypothetical protein
MKFSKILEDLQKSWNNGVYVELPEFRSNERIYVHKSGKLFHVRSRVDGSQHVIPTELTSYEAEDDRWYVKPFQERVPEKFSTGW